MKSNNYLPKEELYNLYVEKGLSTKTIRAHFKCRNSKIVNECKYYGFYNCTKRIISSKKHRSWAMLGNINGKRQTTLPLINEIKRDFKLGMLKKDIMKKHNISGRGYTYNIHMHNLKRVEKDQFVFRLSKYHLNKLNKLSKLEPRLKHALTGKTLSNQEVQNLFNLWIEIQEMANVLKRVIKGSNKLKYNRGESQVRKRKRISSIGVSFPNSDMEFEMLRLMRIDLKLDIYPQMKIENHKFDFYIKGTNILIEVDGVFHRKQKDKDLKINEIALNNKYNLIRIEGHSNFSYQPRLDLIKEELLSAIKESKDQKDFSVKTISTNL